MRVIIDVRAGVERADLMTLFYCMWLHLNPCVVSQRFKDEQNSSEQAGTSHHNYFFFVYESYVARDYQTQNLNLKTTCYFQDLITEDSRLSLCFGDKSICSTFL